MLWDEYIERCPERYRYSRFCELYRGWASRLCRGSARPCPRPQRRSGTQGAPAEGRHPYRPLADRRG
jgi:transposase